MQQLTKSEQLIRQLWTLEKAFMKIYLKLYRNQSRNDDGCYPTKKND
jgi:hypothetical protein